MHLDGFQLRTLPTSDFGTRSNSGSDRVEPDDLTNKYASGKFDINSYIVRRTADLPTATNISWYRTASSNVVDVTLHVDPAVVATNLANYHVFDNNGKSVANAKRDIFRGSGTVGIGDKYLIVFSGAQMMSGYYTLTMLDLEDSKKVGGKYVCKFSIVDANFTQERKERVDNGRADVSLTFSDMEVLFIRCQNTGKDWTFPNTHATGSDIHTQKSSYDGSASARPDNATLLSKSTDLMTGTITNNHSSLQGDAAKQATTFTNDSQASETLVNRAGNAVLHSNGGDKGLGTIPMMTDERRVYRIFSMTDLSRYNTDSFKLVDLPTRIDMRDVIVSVIRPRGATQTTDPDQDKFDSADILVFGQLADFSNMIRTTDGGDAVRFLHPFGAGNNRSEMPFTQRSSQASANGGSNGFTVDAMSRYHTHSFPVALHSQIGVLDSLNYRMSCPNVLGKGDTTLQRGLSNCALAKDSSDFTKGTITFSYKGDVRESGLVAGDRVVISTDNINAPNGLTVGNNNHNLYAGSVLVIRAIAIDANGIRKVEIDVQFDENVSNIATGYLTASSRPRRIINEPRSIAVTTPSWGFKNDSVHGPHAIVNSIQESVKEGTYVVGINDSGRSNAVMNASALGVPDLTADSHYNSAARNHPFSVDNLVNMIPGTDIYDM